jgi:hypothetical protein
MHILGSGVCFMKCCNSVGATFNTHQLKTRTIEGLIQHYLSSTKKQNKQSMGYNLHAPTSTIAIAIARHHNSLPSQEIECIEKKKESHKKNKHARSIHTHKPLPPSRLPAAVHTFQREHASLGLVAFHGEVVERAGRRAHAWSGGFGLDLGRLFGHDGHFLVDDGGGFWCCWLDIGGGCGCGDRCGAGGVDVFACGYGGLRGLGGGL